MKKKRYWLGITILFLSAFLFLIPMKARAVGLFFILPIVAHCDTMDGPVIKDAQMALEKGEVTPVLKWVKKEDEAEIKSAFQKTLLVRNKGPEAKELADRYFFETLVRIHRASEGAPYEGIKPAGTDLGPAVKEADLALESGKIETLHNLIISAVSQGLKERFEKALELKKHKDESIEAGRKYVEAYVDYVHFAEQIYKLSKSSKMHHHQEEKREAHHH